MRPAVANLIAAALGVLVAEGCASTSGRGPLALFDGGPRQPDAAASQEAESPDRTPTALAQSSGRDFTVRPVLPHHPSSLPANDGPFDSETQALIEQELRSASPEEREQLLADFDGLNPVMVKQLLRMRRIVNRMGQQAPDAHGESASESVASFEGRTSYPGERPAADVNFAGLQQAQTPGGLSVQNSAATGAVGYSQNRASATAGAAERGLGAADPWNRSYRPNLDQNVWPAVEPTDPPASTTSPATALASIIPRLDAFPGFGSGAVAAEQPAVEPHASSAGPAIQVIDSAGPTIEAVGAGTDLERLIARLERELQQSPASPDAPQHSTVLIEKHVFLRLLYLMAGRQEQAIAYIPGLSAADQQFWQQLLWSLANYFDVESMPDLAERMTQTLVQLRAAEAHLQEHARLKLANVAFCTKISSFGNYERFDPYEFSPGQPVLLYAEVENFHSEPATDDRGENVYRTVLRSKIEVLSPNGEIRYQMEFPPTEDLCRNYRRDYFHSYEFTVPPRISYGNHVLLLTVEDQLSRKLATYRLNLTVK